jgi:Zn-dependent M28 family amino/carboxypeptidase
VNDDQQRAEAMQARVEYLASPELEGRAPGTPGGLLARAHVEAAFAELGLVPAGLDGYQQAIPEIDGANLLGVVPGTGPHADRYIVVNAHYDHLGINFGQVYPGADDNASGVAVLLDVAQRLVEQGGLDRSVLVMSVDAEEPPHFYTPTMGSIYFVDHPTVLLEQIDLMICLDLIGHPFGPPTLPPDVRNSILVMGAEKSPGVGAIVDRLGREATGIVPRRLDSDIIPPMSDHYAFGRAGIPFLFFNVGRDRHYHTPQDTAEKLDYQKMVALADYLTVLIGELAARDKFGYEEQAVDDTATLTTLVELGRHAGPLHRKSAQVMALVGKLGQRLETGTPLSRGDRGTLQATLLALEEALK